MRRGVKALALGWLLLGAPVWALDLVRIATIPQGYSSSDDPIPVGDADHDGRPELYFEQGTQPFSLNVWEHWGNNSYQRVAKRNGCHPSAVGDPDEDGLTDVLCQWAGRAFLLESRTPETFPSRTVWEEPVGGFPGIRGYFQDTDQDGRQEMWIVPNDPDVIEVWENRRNNRYVQVALLTDPLMNPVTLAFGDFDGDGRTEIVVGDVGSILFVWETTGDDAWAVVWMYDFPLNWVTEIVAAARDLDGDGKPEFLVGGNILDTFEHFVAAFEATGDNTYELIWQLRGARTFALTRIAVGDVDGDGVEEFAVAFPGAIQIYKAFGDNDFRLIGEVPYFPPSGFGSSATELTDLNGNGVAELIVNGRETPDADPGRIQIYELADLQPPVLIPAWFPARYRTLPGWPLPVELELFNRTGAQQTVDAWVEVYQGPGEGGPQGPRVRQRVLLSQVALAPGVPLIHRVFLGGPPGPGPYTYQLKVGTLPTQVIDTRWFTVNRGDAHEGPEPE